MGGHRGAKRKQLNSRKQAQGMVHTKRRKERELPNGGITEINNSQGSKSDKRVAKAIVTYH